MDNIITKNKKKCGIYILRGANGKCYGGQCTDFDERIKKYKYLHCKSQRAIYNALKCYGFEAFEVIFMSYPYEMLNWAEKWHVRQYKAFTEGYNLTEGGDGGYKVSDETKARMSEAQTGKVLSDETKEKIRKRQLGKLCSDETKKRMSDARRGKNQSEITRRKIAEGNRGKLVSYETRRKQSDAKKGKVLSDETKKKISLTKTADKNHNWKGGAERLCKTCKISKVYVSKKGFVSPHCLGCIYKKRRYEKQKI